MLQRVYLDNFKSLVEFSLPPKNDLLDLPTFTCLVGLNGSGKSTILQAFDFLSQLPQGNIDNWLKQRGWKAKDLTSRFTKRSTISFAVTLKAHQEEIVWKGTYNTRLQRCTAEEIISDGTRVMQIQNGILYLYGPDRVYVSLKDLIYQGSILSVYKLEEDKNPAVKAIRDFSDGMKSLELLNPQLIKSRSRNADDVGFGGEKLTAYFYGLSPKIKEAISKELRIFYPNVKQILSSSLRAGWKTLSVVEAFENGNKNQLETETIHLNDGMLRILTIITQMQSNHSCLLFDEIENGINAELVEQLMDYLVKGKKQVIVTTHSPMVLNYLDDEIAKNGIFLIYRTQAGHTRCGRFFNSALAKEKLSLLGPGEVFVDTALHEVAQELERAHV